MRFEELPEAGGYRSVDSPKAQAVADYRAIPLRDGRGVQAPAYFAAMEIYDGQMFRQSEILSAFESIAKYGAPGDDFRIVAFDARYFRPDYAAPAVFPHESLERFRKRLAEQDFKLREFIGIDWTHPK
jgi:hypothetical protein